jgi:D-amino-acid dehydrogenase
MQIADVAVLGAGMVGVSAALHLQARGRDVVLLDRHGAAGLETSYGNSGLIERGSLFPYVFPRDLAQIAKYALNLSPQANCHYSALPRIAPWLWRHFEESAQDSAARNADALRPLIERCVAEHEALVEKARAGDLLRKSGWIKLHRSVRSFDAGAKEAERLRAFGLRIETLESAALAAREPGLAPLPGGFHYLDTLSIDDPSRLTQAYANLFLSRGGRFLAGDAHALEETADGRWSVGAAEGPIVARELVVALGPWSDTVFRPLGYDIPLAWKRGYHMHYGVRDGARLRHPLLDVESGCLLAPMTRGVRLTTGAEFALRDAPPTPVQIGRCERRVREIFPLGERQDRTPWMGARPCLPDMLPVIGRAPRHAGLWFDFGHQHLGVTLGPVSGRLLAEMMTGEALFVDPTPYRADRF